jgi:hypothetical protein
MLPKRDAMIQTYSPEATDPVAVCDALERGEIVHFPRSPVPFPSPGDLDFLRIEMPRHLRRKNISYHPEVDRVVGVGGGAPVRDRVGSILREHSAEVRSFLERAIEPLARTWTVATSSFRPLQERGRALSAHASNERVHVDAGAYGATHGNRILRFFMNAHPSEDRVWISKGTFPEVYRRYGRASRVAPEDGSPRSLAEGWGNRAYTRLLETAARMGVPMAKLADTSPYDRLMRRFHNFMKDSSEFQESPEGHRRIAFAPGSAWMVFTDMVTHACVSGQHAFIDTFIIPLSNCRHPALTPYAVLQGVPP